MSTLTVEERLAAVEAKVGEIERQKEASQSDKSVPWWERFVGIFEDNAEFEEAVRYGQKWRASEDHLANEDAA